MFDPFLFLTLQLPIAEETKSGIVIKVTVVMPDPSSDRKKVNGHNGKVFTTCLTIKQMTYRAVASTFEVVRRWAC